MHLTKQKNISLPDSWWKEWKRTFITSKVTDYEDNWQEIDHTYRFHEDMLFFRNGYEMPVEKVIYVYEYDSTSHFGGYHMNQDASFIKQ